MKIGFFATFLTSCALVAGAAAAHHSFAMYERERVVTLSGIVTDFEWTSPHIKIAVLADAARGRTVTWVIEAASPGVMSRDGWTSMIMKRGDRVSLGVHPRKDGVVGGFLADEMQILVNGQTPTGVLSLVPLSGEPASGRPAAN